MRTSVFAVFAACLAVTLGLVESTAKEAASHDEVFKQRILPIFRSSNPSSCTECHLAGVDLKDRKNSSRTRKTSARNCFSARFLPTEGQTRCPMILLPR